MYLTVPMATTMAETRIVEGAYHEYEELIPGCSCSLDREYKWLMVERRSVIGKSLKDYDYCKGCFAPRNKFVQPTKTLPGRSRLNRGGDPYLHYCGKCIDCHNARNTTFFDRIAQVGLLFTSGQWAKGIVINGIRNLSSCDGCLRPINVDYSNTTKEHMEMFTNCMVICTCCQKRGCYDCVIDTKRMEFDIKPPTDLIVKKRRPLWVWHGFQHQFKNCVKTFNPAPYGANSLCLKCFEHIFCKKREDSDILDVMERENPPVVDWEGLIHYILNTSAMGFLGQKIVLLIGVFGSKERMIVMR